MFDGSCKTSSKLSLNDCLQVGPVVQPDLFSHLLSFRQYEYAIKSDIVKMFRQFVINSKNADLQRIFWREDLSKPVQEFRLLTVTYGTSAAPFLATRCLVQLALDHGDAFPLAKEALLKNHYVDDLLKSTMTSREANQVLVQLKSLLEIAGLELGKFNSNKKEVLDSIAFIKQDSNEVTALGDVSKALGVRWNCGEDVLTFSDFTPVCENLSKRILSSK